MIDHQPQKIRRARPEDSRELAELMNLAGDGIPAYLWSRMADPGEDPIAFGARRVAGTDGAFSHANAHVAELSGMIAAMLLGYRLAETDDPGSIGDCPPVVRPLLELEASAPGTWYVNAVAAFPVCRGRGVGTALMGFAESLAAETGATALSLIVAEDNDGARRLYERLGYRTMDRREIVPYPGCPHRGDWILMMKSIENGRD